MNSGIVILRDGTPCFLHDDPLPPLKCFEFSLDDYIVTLVWDDAKEGAEKRMRLEHALTPEFARTLDKLRLMAIGRVENEKIGELKTLPVKITFTPDREQA